MKPQKPRLQGTNFALSKWGPNNGASSGPTTKKYRKHVGSYRKTCLTKRYIGVSEQPPQKKKTTLNPCPHTFPHSDFSSWIWLVSLEAKLPQVCAEPSLPLSFPHGSRALIQEMSRGTSGKFKILVELCQCEAKTPWNIPWKTQNPNSFMKEFHGIWFHLGVFGGACR